MFFKLLWILVVAWIAYRVYRAGRDLVRIALGRGDESLPGTERDAVRGPDRPPRSAPLRRRQADVEDARWEDL